MITEVDRSGQNQTGKGEMVKASFYPSKLSLRFPCDARCKYLLPWVTYRWGAEK